MAEKYTLTLIHSASGWEWEFGEDFGGDLCMVAASMHPWPSEEAAVIDATYALAVLNGDGATLSALTAGRAPPSPSHWETIVRLSRTVPGA